MVIPLLVLIKHVLVDKAITELGQPAKGKFMYLLQMTEKHIAGSGC